MMKNIKKQILLMSIISSCLVQNSFAISPSCRIENIENVSKILCKGFHPIESKKLDQKFKALVEQFNKTNQIANNDFFATLDNWKLSFLEDLKNTIGECRKEIFDSYSESSINIVLDQEKKPIYKELNRIYLSILNLKETSKNKTLQEVNSQIACLEGDLAKLGNSMMIGYGRVNDLGRSILDIDNLKGFQDQKLKILKNKISKWMNILEGQKHPMEKEKQDLKSALESLLFLLDNRENDSIISKDSYDILFNLFFDDKNKFINLSDNCNDALKISQDKDTDALIVNIMGVISQNHNFNPNFREYLNECLKKESDKKDEEFVEFCKKYIKGYRVRRSEWKYKNFYSPDLNIGKVLVNPRSFLECWQSVHSGRLNNAADERGWKIHVSPNINHCKEVLEIVNNLYKEMDFEWKFSCNLPAYRRLGYSSQHGKFIAIYPESDSQASEIVERLNQEFQSKKLNDSDFIELKYDFKVYPGIYTRMAHYRDGDPDSEKDRGRLNFGKETFIMHAIKEKGRQNEEFRLSIEKNLEDLEDLEEKIFVLERECDMESLEELNKAKDEKKKIEEKLVKAADDYVHPFKEIYIKNKVMPKQVSELKAYLENEVID